MAVMPNERRAGVLGLAGSIVPVLTGLVASAMLAVDYTRAAPIFCTEGGGCESLKHTAIAFPLGVPLPFFGVAGFLVLGVVSLLRGERARVAQLGLAAIAGLVGLSLLVLQLRLGTLCPYCCTADVSGIVSAIVAGARLRLAPSAQPPPAAAYAAGLLLVLAPAVPLASGFHASTVPRVIRDEIAQTPPGKVTVVDFVDFECPFCRMTNAELEPLLAARRGRIRLVRRQVPLAIHPHAMDAARAACCGEKLGKGDEMAQALFSAPEEQLTRAGCEQIALKLGLSADAFRACVADPAIDALIAADKAEFKSAGGFALPTLWIDGKSLVGAQPGEAIERALDTALAHAGS
jgi:protein-disulfide isomerase